MNAIADLAAYRKNCKDIKNELKAMEASIEDRKAKLKKQLKTNKNSVRKQFRTYMSRKGFIGKAIFGPRKSMGETGPDYLDLVGVSYS